MLEIESGIYRIVNTNSGNLYVGSAVNLAKRWQHHKEDARNGTHYSKALQNAWDKHGEDAFSFEVIEYVENPDKLIEREQYWIDTLEAYSKGYNCSPTAGSPRGVKHSEEARRNMSRAHIEWNERRLQEGKSHPSKGKKMRPEVVEANRQTQLRLNAERRARGEEHPSKGRKASPEEVEAHRQRRLKYVAERKALGLPVSNEGYKWTSEQIEKVRLTRIGRPQSEETRRKRSESMKKRIQDTKDFIVLMWAIKMYWDTKVV